MKMLLINDQKVNFFIFPGGEIQVKLPEKIEGERVVLTWLPIDSNDILTLLLTVNSLKHSGHYDIVLDVLYLPYARQDRVCSRGEAFSLEVICSILDNLNLSLIKIWDVHNEERTFDLIKNSRVFNVTCKEIFARYKILDDFDLSNLIICAPDKGSLERASQVSFEFDLGYCLGLDKSRDVETGKIKEIKFSNLTNRPKYVDGYNILIVDDICDGGRTFIEASEFLKKHGAQKIYLYVTHGIFSNGLGELTKNFDYIYCHHVLHNDRYKSFDFLTILKEFS